MDKKNISKRIKDKVRLRAIGNSGRKLKHVAQDLVNASDLGYGEIAEGCFLCKATVKNLARGTTHNPQSETVERVFRFFDMRVDLNGEPIKGKYANQPKQESKA